MFFLFFCELVTEFSVCRFSFYVFLVYQTSLLVSSTYTLMPSSCRMHSLFLVIRSLASAYSPFSSSGRNTTTVWLDLIYDRSCSDAKIHLQSEQLSDYRLINLHVFSLKAPMPSTTIELSYLIAFSLVSRLVYTFYDFTNACRSHKKEIFKRKDFLLPGLEEYEFSSPIIMTLSPILKYRWIHIYRWTRSVQRFHFLCSGL